MTLKIEAMILKMEVMCILKYIQIENRIWIFHNITVLLYFDQINAAFVVPGQKGNKTR